jgi:hypothetical protein
MAIDWSQLFGGALQAGGLLSGGLLAKEAYEDLGQAGQTAYERSRPLAQQLLQQTQFRPFTVTTGVGSLQATPEGGYTSTLSPQQQALQDQLMGGAQGFYGQATAPLAQRQQQVYDALRAVQMPEEERARLDLEQRLAAQGRLGLQTAQYGGSPESFALAKAQAEARNQASVTAIEQAMREQSQQAELGRLYQTMGYAPLDAQLSAYAQGLGGAGLAQAAQQAGAGLFGEAEMSGLSSLLAGRIAQANLAGQLGTALLQGTTQGMFAQEDGSDLQNILGAGANWLARLLGGGGGSGGSIQAAGK